MAVNATAVWRVRPSGSNTNGGGYDPGISGAATDYSQQNAAQATGTVGTAAGTTAFSDAGGAFTAAMIGNALWIASGAGFTVGAYFITAFTSSTAVTLDRSPGTGTVAHWSLGGGWATHANLASTGPLVNFNTVYFLGSGTPNPASYTYDYDLTSAITMGAAVTLANDPATPGYKAPPDTTGGMPVIKFDVNGDLFKGTFTIARGLWFVGTATAAAGKAVFRDSSTFNTVLLGCVFDQFGQDLVFLNATATINSQVIGCEVFSSVAAGAGSWAAITVSTGSASALTIDSCNIHDCVGYGITGAGVYFILNSIIAKCGVDGMNVGSGNCYVKNNTIDGNVGNGLVFAGQTGSFINNILSNHTGGGKSGFVNNTSVSDIADYNIYYNNTTDIGGSNSAYGPHDTHGGSNPYVGQSTENYTLA